MKPSPISMIIIGPNQQERATVRTQLLASGKVHIVAESGDYNRGLELVKQFNPQAVLVALNGSLNQPLQLVERITEAHPAAVICTGEECPPQTIVKAYRAGATDFLCQPLKSEEVSEALAKVDAIRSDTEAASHTGQIVAVYSANGGSGKTTIAVNLASALAKGLKHETVVIDFNLQCGMLPLFFGTDAGYTITDVVQNQDRLDDQLLRSYLLQVTDRLHCLPAPAHVHEAFDVKPNHVQRVLSMLRTQFSQVVVDCQGALDNTTLTVLDMADVILLVSAPDPVSVHNTKRSLNYLQQLGYPVDKIKVVVNRYNRKASVPVEKLHHVFGTRVAAVLSEDARTTKEAMNLGQPVVFAQSDSPLIRQYAKLARIVAGIREVEKLKRPGLFRSLFGPLFGLKPRAAACAAAQA
jgi:pilus assembly protein CpaE